MASNEIGPDLESPFELREVEPSPVEETPQDLKPDSYFPSDTHQPSRSTTFIGLGEHGPAYYLTRLQKYSTYAFSIFATFHITNTAIIPLITQSVPASEPYLLLTRPYYQARPFEPLLVAGPLFVHVASGLALRVYRRQQSKRRYGAESREDRKRLRWPPVSGISALGFVAVPLVMGHMLASRVVPMWLEGGSANVGLEYISHGFAKHPAVSFTGFSVLVSTVVWHITWGWARWLSWTPAQVTTGGSEGQITRKRRWYAVNGVALVTTAIWLAGGLGIVGRGGETLGWQAKIYDQIYQSIPVVGKWF
ncbi:hypothetical protein BT63DRAFT_459373 [Microthyrium microscopicum]|uniref:Mitochondrial adapter protein MCP1 transmembrane domain-containing protein n=1 Tax=Microthyrium microscopicum TaxID=703497 RepID=A0A6A6U304_9PEZI|nr:hypothetical protein BT63DRAFT_459373 [Microthyrium microscopicum]